MDVYDETFYLEPTTGELLEIVLDHLRNNENEDGCCL